MFNMAGLRFPPESLKTFSRRLPRNCRIHKNAKLLNVKILICCDCLDCFFVSLVTWKYYGAPNLIVRRSSRGLDQFVLTACVDLVLI